MGFKLLLRRLRKLRVSSTLGDLFPQGGMKKKVKDFLESFLSIPALVGGTAASAEEGASETSINVGGLKDIDFKSIFPKPYGLLFKTTSLKNLVTFIDDIETYVKNNSDKPEKCLFLGLNLFFILMVYRTMMFAVLLPITSGTVEAKDIKFSDLNLSRAVLNKVKYANDLMDKTVDEIISKDIEKQDLRYLFVIAKRLLIMEG